MCRCETVDLILSLRSWVLLTEECSIWFLLEEPGKHRRRFPGRWMKSSKGNKMGERGHWRTNGANDEQPRSWLGEHDAHS